MVGRPSLTRGLMVLALSLLSASAAAPLRADPGFASLFKILEETPTGKNLVLRTLHAWQIPDTASFSRFLRWGVASKTDAVLTRRYDPNSGQEIRSRELTISLREDQSLNGLVLDLAHELVHASVPQTWDPYDPALTAARYIHASIEGSGGEVDAVSTECQIHLELNVSPTAPAPGSRCERYVKLSPGATSSPRIDIDRVRKDFYRVGQWAERIEKELGSERALFPWLSPLVPRLYSSTGNAPYPAALLDEFYALNQTACQNMKRRLDASHPFDVRRAQEIRQFLDQRCKTL